VQCSDYKEHPLIGKVTEKRQDEVVMDWYIGSYSGTWREWKGRDNGKTVVFSQTIKCDDIYSSPDEEYEASTSNS